MALSDSGAIFKASKRPAGRGSGLISAAFGCMHSCVWVLMLTYTSAPVPLQTLSFDSSFASWRILDCLLLRRKIEVKAIVPMAKALNLGVVMERTQKELGGFPVAAKDYVDKHLLGRYMETAAGQAFLNITDPYFYINRLVGLPKFVIQTGNDDFFIPDNTIEWWAAVPEPKWQLGGR